jgi:hypothetical protein
MKIIQELLREQCSCLAHLVWEQQLHICDLNDRALRHINERKRILNGNDAPIQKNVDEIVAVMKELQLSLQRRHEVITGILTPIDTTAIATTMSKLKSALVEITTLNSQLVMRNNKLACELSFMPPAMRQKLIQAKNQRSKIYLEQRTNPHHLIPDTVKKVEFCFVPADMSDPNVAMLQRDETVTSIHELLAEVEDVMNMTGLKFNIPIEIDNNLEQFEDEEILPEKYDPSSAPKARSICSVNADEGANMRSHGNFMHKGHWVHPYRDPTLTYEEPPALYPNKTIGGNDEERANKRSHENAVPTGHRMHPSKVPRKEPSDRSDQSSIADSSDDMNQSSSASSYDSAHYAPTAQSTKFYRKPFLHPSQDGETNPYSPIQRGLVEYDITRDDRAIAIKIGCLLNVSHSFSLLTYVHQCVVDFRIKIDIKVFCYRSFRMIGSC